MKSDSEQNKKELLNSLLHPSLEKIEEQINQQFSCLLTGIGAIILITGTILLYIILV